jgi:hypothetical protein
MMLLWSSNSTVRGTGWNASYSMTVGTEEKENFTKLNVFPNPASDKLNIAFTLTESQNVKVEILSLNGLLLYTESINSVKGDFNRTINISEYAKGIYLLKLTSDRGTSVRKVVVE